MLKYFQAAFISRYLVILSVAIVYWVPSFILPAGPDFSSNLSEDSFWRFFSSVYFLNSLALAIVLLSGLFINQIATEYGITVKINLITIFLFVVLASSLSSFTQANPFILINLLLVFVLRLLFSIPTTKNQIPVVFNAAFLVGFASIFYTPLLILILLIWISFIIHRSNHWRNYTSSIIGLVLPYLFMFTWYFWNDQLQQFLEIWTELFVLFPIWETTFGILDITIATVLIVLLFLSFMNMISRLTEKNINLRRNLIIVGYSAALLFTVVVLFHRGLSTGLLLVVPAALLMANYFTQLKKQKPINFILGLLLLAIFLNQYFKFSQLVF